MRAPPTRFPLPAMKEDGPVPGAAKHREDALQRRVLEGAGSHRDVDVLHAQLAHQRGFIHGAGFHGVPKIQHDPPTGLLQGFELFGGRLAAGDHVGKYLAGVGDAADGLKCSGHWSPESSGDGHFGGLVRPIHDHPGAFQSDQPPPIISSSSGRIAWIFSSVSTHSITSGRSRESRRTFSVWTPALAPKPMMPGTRSRRRKWRSRSR